MFGGRRESYGSDNRDNCNRCVDYENRRFFNRCGNYGSENRDLLTGMGIIIFNFAILPIGVETMNLNFAILPIGVEIVNPKFASCRGTSEMDEVSKMELLKF